MPKSALIEWMKAETDLTFNEYCEQHGYENRMANQAKESNMSENDEPITQKDGFRPRRKRERGWLKAAIKSGEVRDPNAPPDEPIDYSGTGATVVKAPMATLDGDGR